MSGTAQSLVHQWRRHRRLKTPAADHRRMNPKFHRQLRQGLLPRKRRHRPQAIGFSLENVSALHWTRGGISSLPVKIRPLRVAPSTIPIRKFHCADRFVGGSAVLRLRGDKWHEWLSHSLPCLAQMTLRPHFAILEGANQPKGETHADRAREAIRRKRA
jgi:hypothetical protein